MHLLQENEKVFFFFYEQRLTLHLLVNTECRKPILALRRNSLDLLATIRVTTCIYAQLLKKYAFSPFSRVVRQIST